MIRDKSSRLAVVDRSLVYTLSSSLNDARELARAVIGNAAGAAIILGGWYEATITDSGAIRTRLTWLAVTISGLAVSGACNSVWLLRNRHRFNVARAQLLDQVNRIGTAARRPDGERDEGVRLAGPGMSRYHRAGCELVIGKAVRAKTARQHTSDGLRPCEVCDG